MARHSAPKGDSYRPQEPLYDTAVATPSHAERARTLCASVGTATLCTLTRQSHPYGSFVTYALDGGSPVFLISALAEHTQNVRRDGRVSLLVAESGDGDPLARARVTLVGDIGELAPAAGESARGAFLAAHPSAGYYVDFDDFSFWRLAVSGVRYIGGYGRMSWVDVSEWEAAEPDPIAPAARRIIEHMNEDHAEAMRLCCLAFSRATEVSAATMTSVDRYGFEMSAVTEAGPRPIRLAYPSPAESADAVRTHLVAMVRHARERVA